MLRRLQLEKALLLGRLPSVALGNIKKFPWDPPGEHSVDGLGSCYIRKYLIIVTLTDPLIGTVSLPAGYNVMVALTGLLI